MFEMIRRYISLDGCPTTCVAIDMCTQGTVRPDSNNYISIIICS